MHLVTRSLSTRLPVNKLRRSSHHALARPSSSSSSLMRSFSSSSVRSSSEFCCAFSVFRPTVFLRPPSSVSLLYRPLSLAPAPSCKYLSSASIVSELIMPTSSFLRTYFCSNLSFLTRCCSTISLSSSASSFAVKSFLVTLAVAERPPVASGF